ncbi:glucoamylase family protein [Roseivirga sp. BDSF3-8]|uniref:glucoamylase family protein n=1 Tax=Roseivirga sp. BDSF3-8 TaxID=3241598 RepID=UPI0035321576
MFKYTGILCLCSIWLLIACSDEQTATNSGQNPPPDTVPSLSDQELFDMVHEQTFRYFYDYAEPQSGVARERFHADNVYPQDDKNIVTSGGGGFGVMALLVGIERGWITRQQGYQRLRQIVDFLETADRFHGVWPHWMNGETGQVKPFSAKDNGGDLVETSFMIQGLLCVRQYFKDGSQEEQQLAADIDTLWQEVEWDWYRRDGENVLYWHWSPNFGWDMNFPLRGYNECLITYVLAASSPTHGIPAEVYHEGWARNGNIVDPVEAYGHRLDLHHNGAEAYGGPLFWAHYSYLGLDPRNLSDRYTNYWEHNTNHSLINYDWCVENPNNYEGYGENCWGLTASYSVNGYAGHRPGNDLGVISPTAALSSIPYTPDKSMAAMRYFYEELGSKVWGVAGFYDAFSEEKNFYPQRYLAIDQGPIVVMMENHRTGLLWDLFMSCPEVQQGLDKLDFTY